MFSSIQSINSKSLKSETEQFVVEVSQYPSTFQLYPETQASQEVAD